MKKLIQFLISVTMIFGLLVISTTSSYAYSCKAVYIEAEKLIEKAESLVSKTTDSRIKAMIEEAKGLADSGIISHKAANERHTGNTGKYAHGDAVRKGRQAVALAKEALFLLTGTPH